MAQGWLSATTVDAGVYPAKEGEASKICESWVGVSLIEGKAYQPRELQVDRLS